MDKNIKENIEKYESKYSFMNEEEVNSINESIKESNEKIANYEKTLESLNFTAVDADKELKEKIESKLNDEKNNLKNLEDKIKNIDDTKKSDEYIVDTHAYNENKLKQCTQEKMEAQKQIEKISAEMQMVLTTDDSEKFKKYSQLQDEKRILENKIKEYDAEIAKIKENFNEPQYWKNLKSATERIERESSTKDAEEQENDEKKASEKENDDKDNNEKENNEKDVDDKDNNEKENDAEPVVNPEEIEKIMKDDENEAKYEDIEDEDISLVPKESMMDKFKKTKIAGVFKGLFNGAKKFFSSIKNFVDRRRAAKEEYGDNGKMWKNTDKASKDETEKNEIDEHIEILSKIANEAENERNAKNGSFIPHVDVNEAEAVAKTEASKESETKEDKGREMGD